VMGTGEQHAAFAEPQFNLEPVTRRGAPEIASELLQALYADGCELAHSSELQLDHGTTLPLQLMRIPEHVAVIPLIINSIFPPLPSLRRCLALGDALARAISRLTSHQRIGLLATGGISHTVGAPGMESNDPAFDAHFLKALVDGRLETICDCPDDVLDRAGNGTHEIRNWIVAAAAAQARRPEVVTAIPFAPGWNSGVHQLLWEAE
jgi:aromatic ring-opening dioxygenase catalytic subunit (LigB family)